MRLVFWHPSGVRITSLSLPEVPASLRPPATFSQPFGLQMQSYLKLLECLQLCNATQMIPHYRAFDARVSAPQSSKARFNGLTSGALAVMLKLLILSTLEAR